MTNSRPSSWLESEDGTPVPLEGGVEKRFGRYVLSRRIASGGMGTVYLARAVGPGGFDLPVAIKVIHPHLARRQDLVDMFLDEARITARIRHPNVCSVLDFGESDGTWYLAMEYLLGETLASVIGHLSRDPRALDDPRYRAIATRIIADACEGLHAAHELVGPDGRPMNVVHRDVSPHNLLVTYDGAVKVLDFGIALAKDRVHQTTTGGLKGKYAYMPPEQLRKRPLDRRADVWALGVCLWEVLTGLRLFRRETEMDTLLAVRGADIPPPSAVRPSIPTSLDPIVLAALHRDPAQRTPTARELGRALSGWLRIQPEPHGLVETSEWLGQLFSQRRAHKAEVVRTVMSTGIVPAIPEAARGGARGADGHVDFGERVGAGTASLPSPVAGRVGSSTASVPSPAMPGVELTGPIAPPLPHHGPPSIAAAPTAIPTPTRRRTFPLVLAALAVVAALMGLSVGLGMWLGLNEKAEGAGVGAERRAAEPPEAEAQTQAAGAGSGDPAAGSETETETEAEAETETETETASDAETETSTVASSRSPRMQRPAMRAAPAGEGTVNVVTPGGWAEVHVAGRSYGRTPRRITLPSGRHTIELRPFGRTPPIRVPAAVRSGESTRVVRAVTR